MSEGTHAPEQVAENQEIPQPEKKGPEIGKNLFWDDFRIGLIILAGGALLVVVSILLTYVPYLGWLGYLGIFLGGVGTVLGVKVCASIPEESGVSLFGLAALGAATLCLLGVLVHFFAPGLGLLVPTVILWALALDLFAWVMRGAADFLQSQVLGLLTMLYVGVAIITSLLFVVFAVSGGLGNAPTQVILILVGIATVLFLSYLATEISRAIGFAQQGLPVGGQIPGEKVTAEVGAPEEQAVAGEHHETPGTTEESPVFSETDVEKFRTSDSSAGRAIVMLMTIVFAIGVFMYTIVAFMAAYSS